MTIADRDRSPVARPAQHARSCRSTLAMAGTWWSAPEW